MQEKVMTSKIALVTGSGSGIGRAAALALSKAGFSVCLAGRRREPLEETAALAQGGETLVAPADVTDPASVAALFQSIETRFGRLDVLFNNAGGNVPATNFGDLTWDQWAKVVGINLNGMFLVANGAYRMMRDQTPGGGRIINNGSISATTPRPGAAPYTATKHAVTGLTKTIALDGRNFDIACGQINIGNAATEMTARMAKGVIQADGSMAIEPTIDVQNVANAVAFMASLSLNANVLDMSIMATKMPFAGRG
jgi:NAD(P)-dependent dehydrogenase (short-subunit alcohol dehydrogenase family)